MKKSPKWVVMWNSYTGPNGKKETRYYASNNRGWTNSLKAAYKFNYGERAAFDVLKFIPGSDIYTI